VQGSDVEDPAVALRVGGRIILLRAYALRRAIKDIMKAQGIPDFHAPPPIPKFIDTGEAIDELPTYDSFEPSPQDF
jgi:hypothetical protein